MRVPEDTIFVYDERSGEIDPFLMHDQLLGNPILGANPRRWIGEESERCFQFLTPVCHAEYLLRVNDQDLCVALEELRVRLLELSQFPVAHRSPIC